MGHTKKRFFRAQTEPVAFKVNNKFSLYLCERQRLHPGQLLTLSMMPIQLGNSHKQLHALYVNIITYCTYIL